MATEMPKQLITQINALAQKQREQGLTQEETAQQQALRQQYLEIFRGNFREMLEGIEIVDEENTQ